MGGALTEASTVMQDVTRVSLTHAREIIIRIGQYDKVSSKFETLTTGRRQVDCVLVPRVGCWWSAC